MIVRRYHSVVEKLPLRELQKLPQSEQDSRMWIRLAENIKKVQSHLYSKRLANVNKTDERVQWKHVMIRRYETDQIWICFSPEDIEDAKKYHSYPYFRDCLLKGETILASPHTCAWNTLGKDEKILGIIYSPDLGKVSHWDMKNRVINARNKFNF